MKRYFKVYILVLLVLSLFLYPFKNSHADDDYEYIHGVNNLLLIGKNDLSKSYCNFFIVLTIDSINKGLTLTSLSKDTYISEFDCSLYEMYLDKGEYELINTIKRYFNITIDNYVVINDKALCKIIDSTNTVNLNSSKASGYEVLDFLFEKKYLTTSKQEKYQVYVIQELLYGFSRLPFTNYPYVIKETFPYVKIDITPFKMLSLGFTALSLKNYTAIVNYLK